jgi:hypothetical protein
MAALVQRQFARKPNVMTAQPHRASGCRSLLAT